MKRNPLMYLLVVAVCLYLLYSFTTGSDHDMPFRASTESRLTQSPDRNTESSNFRQTTPEEIAHSIKGGHAVHPDIEKEQLIKDLATEKQPASVSSIAHSQNPAPAAEIEEQSVAGRKMMPKVQQPEKPKYPVTTDEKPKFVIGEEPARNGGKTEKAKDPATLAAESELDEILKRSPSKRMPPRVPNTSSCKPTASRQHLMSWNSISSPRRLNCRMTQTPTLSPWVARSRICWRNGRAVEQYRMSSSMRGVLVVVTILRIWNRRGSW
jgi:hypothetical protein